MSSELSDEAIVTFIVSEEAQVSVHDLFRKKRNKLTKIGVIYLFQ